MRHHGTMKVKQPAEINKLIKNMKRISAIIANGHLGGAYDKVLKYFEQEEELIKLFQGDIPKEIKNLHILWLWFRADIYAYKGNLTLSFKDAKELLTVAQLYDHKRGISNGRYVLGRYYWLSGDLDKALVHIDNAIRLSEENLNDLMDFLMLADQLDLATRVSIDKEDIKRAKKYFRRLEEIRELKHGEFAINDIYRYVKALLLKNLKSFIDLFH